MVKKDIYYTHIDSLKGLAIFLMVMGHAAAWAFEDRSFFHQPMCELSESELSSSILYIIIYSFHMPLLFFVSGFLFYKDHKFETGEGLRKVICRRMSRILLPYFITGFILFWFQGTYGYWFLQVLFLLNILLCFSFYIIQKYNLNLQKQIVVHLCMGGAIFLISHLPMGWAPPKLIFTSRLWVYYFPFLMGCLMRQHNRVNKFLTHEYTALISLFVFLIFFILHKYYGLYKDLSFIMPLFMIIYLNRLFLLSQDNNKVLSTIGRNSMDIYILHVYFVWRFTDFGKFLLSNHDIWTTNMTFVIVYTLLTSSVAIFLSIIVSKFLSASNTLHKLLFGK